MAGLVGPDIVARYRIHQHRSDDADHVEVGEVDGVPVLLDRRYVEADRRILTGFVEPHFFAGWSGGPKGACPGLAATATILEAHSPARIADPAVDLVGHRRETRCTSSSARPPSLCPPDLSVDVTIDTRRRLTGVFAGTAARRPPGGLCLAARPSPAPCPDRFDVVLTTNGGHPLDRNLYQSVKGLAAAERVVADGGIIVMAAPAPTAFPTTAPSPASSEQSSGIEELARPGGPGAGGWLAGPGAGPGARGGPRCGCTPKVSPTTRSAPPGWSRSHDLADGGGRGAGRAAGPAGRGSACCPRDHSPWPRRPFDR